MSNSIDNKMVYSEVEKMSGLCQKAANELDQTISRMGQIANQLRNGALQGKAGDALVDAISKDLTTSLSRLRDKMNEIHRDLNGAIANHRDNTNVNATRFK